MPEAVADRARELVERAQAADLGTTAGLHPEALAAACLIVAYGLTGEKRPFTQAELVAAIGSTEATLPDRPQDLCELIEQ